VFELSKCPNCGGPLPAAPQGEVVVCAFCDAELRKQRAFEVREARGRVPIPEPTPVPNGSNQDQVDMSPSDLKPAPVTRGAPTFFWALAGALLALVSLGFILQKAIFVRKTALPTQTSARVAITTSSQMATIRLTEIASTSAAELQRGVYLSTIDFSVDTSEYDLLNLLTQAQLAARSWRADAQLASVKAQPVLPNGKLRLNGTDGSFVRYEFTAGRCETTTCSFALTARANTPARIESSGPGAEAIETKFCPPTKMIPYLIQKKQLPERLSYHLSLQREGTHAKWTVSAVTTASAELVSSANAFAPVAVRGACTTIQ
jgi:hypothetical protein